MTAENLTRDEARERGRLLHVDSYDVHLDLSAAGTEGRVFPSSSTVRFTCTEPGASAHIDITADRIVAATLNDEPIDVGDAFTGTRLQLPALAATNELTITADCVYSRTGEGLHRFVDPVDDEVYLYSQFETFDAHRMFACFDQPDLKASFAFTIDAPEHWHVVSTMPATQNGRRRVFLATPRQSTYITAVVAGAYHEIRDSHDGIPLGLYCRASLAEHLDADEILTVTKQGFDAFHAMFGVRYAWPKYDQLFVPEFNMGAMENAGCVTFTESYVFRSRTTDAARERRAVTILHEMAHMWFGDLVTMAWWDDLWLNESFAEFVSTLVTTESTRWTEAWTSFATVEKSWAYRQDQLPTTHPIAADIPDIEAVIANFDGITYAKGASVLKQLVHWVGRDAFVTGLRAYFERHAFGTTTLADLLDPLSEASGRDLSAWSEVWLCEAGLTTLRPLAEVDGAGHYTSFAVEQEAPAEHPVLRPHRLRIGLYDLLPDGLRRRDQIELDVTGASTPVAALIGVAQPDLLLLNDDDLAYAKVRLDERSWQTVVRHLHELPDSLARALCWATAWDMTRDSEVPVSDYFDLVIGSVGRETDIGVVQSLLTLARQSADPYGDPKLRDARRAQLSGRALELLDTAEPGSDLQLAFARSAALSATTDAQLDRISRLFSGDDSLPGLAVDTELRWVLLHRLVVMGKVHDDVIDAERARDATADGHRHWLRARAARPTKEAKQDAWHAIVEADSLPNADQNAVVAGFVTREHREVLEPYVDRYFASIGALYRDRSAEMAQNLIEGLYPHWLPVQDVVDRTDAYLRDEQPGPALRRMLVESRDMLARALRAQSRDHAAR